MKIKIQKNVNILTEQEVHTVSKGETLSGIGKRYGMDWRQIAKANNIQGPKFIIQPGQKLKLGVEKQIGGDPDTDTDPIRILASMVAPFVLANISREFQSPGITNRDIDSITTMLYQYHREKMEDGKASDRILAILRFKMKSAADGAKTHVSRVLRTKPPEVIDPILKGLGKLGLLNDSAITRIIEAICSVMLDVMMGENSSDIIKSNLGEYANLYDEYKFEKLPINQSELTKIKQFSIASAEKYALRHPGIRKKARDDFAAKKKLASDLKDKINESQKVFENYFTKNKHLLEQEMYELPVNDEFEEEIASAIETKLDDPTVTSLVKNQDTAERIYAIVMQNLKDPERMRTTISSVVDDIFDQIPDSPEEIT